MGIASPPALWLHSTLDDAFYDSRPYVASNKNLDFVPFLGAEQGLGKRRLLIDYALGWVGLRSAYRDLQYLPIVTQVLDSHRVANCDGTTAVRCFLRATNADLP